MLLEQLTPLREPRMRVELDKRALFALASDTRLDILKSLQPMRRTVTQLADSLGIDKAAVHRHLKTLEEGGFVKRYEDHGFVYYGLSWKSRDLLSPNENTRVVILLSACIVLIGVLAVLATIASVEPGILDEQARNFSPTGTEGDAADYDVYELAESPVFWPLMLFGIAISFITAVAFSGAFRIIRRPRQPGMAREDQG